MNDSDNNHELEGSEAKFISNDRLAALPAKRNGLVNAWLSIMLIVNLFAALIYSTFLVKNITQPKISETTEELIILITLINVFFVIRLFLWKKDGFYGLCVTTIISFFVNIIIGLSAMAVIWGLVGIFILYGILQIKKNGITAWSYLK